MGNIPPATFLKAEVEILIHDTDYYDTYSEQYPV